jgi:DNA-binding GntR family transcriptional regulator
MARKAMRRIDRATSLADQAQISIKDAIRNGIIQPKRFYSEQGIADSLNISRTPVREAVLHLEHEGLLEVLPQRGFRIRDIPPVERDEIFELRTLLEVHIVKKGARRIDDSGIREIWAILERQARKRANFAAFLDADEEFHLRIAELAGFNKAKDFLAELRGTVWLLGFEALDRPQRVDRVLDEHRAIIESLEHKNANGAARAMKQHLDSTHEAVIEVERARSA